jgi:hypothetical protein
MDRIKPAFWLMFTIQKKSTPPGAPQLLRSREFLCRRRTKLISDPAPLSHFRAYRQRPKLISSTSPYSEPQESRPVSSECSPLDVLLFSVALRSMAALGEPEVQSDMNGSGPSPAKLEVHKVSDLRSYHFDQTTTTRLKRTITYLASDPCRFGSGKGMGA